MENQAGSDMFTFMGLHSGLLSLVGGPSVPPWHPRGASGWRWTRVTAGSCSSWKRPCATTAPARTTTSWCGGFGGPSQGSSVVRVRKIQDWELRLFACPPEKRTADCDTYEEQQDVFHGPVLFDGSDNSTAAVRKTRPSTVRRIDLKNEKSSNEPPPMKHTVAMAFPTSTSTFARSVPSWSLNRLKTCPSIFASLRWIEFFHLGGRTSHSPTEAVEISIWFKQEP